VVAIGGKADIRELRSRNEDNRKEKGALSSPVVVLRAGQDGKFYSSAERFNDFFSRRLRTESNDGVNFSLRVALPNAPLFGIARGDRMIGMRSHVCGACNECRCSQ
jgi:hypothetical protein